MCREQGFDEILIKVCLIYPEIELSPGLELFRARDACSCTSTEYGRPSFELPVVRMNRVGTCASFTTNIRTKWDSVVLYQCLHSVTRA